MNVVDIQYGRKNMLRGNPENASYEKREAASSTVKRSKLTESKGTVTGKQLNIGPNWKLEVYSRLIRHHPDHSPDTGHHPDDDVKNVPLLSISGTETDLDETETNDTRTQVELGNNSKNGNSNIIPDSDTKSDACLDPNFTTNCQPRKLFQTLFRKLDVQKRI